MTRCSTLSVWLVVALLFGSGCFKSSTFQGSSDSSSKSSRSLSRLSSSPSRSLGSEDAYQRDVRDATTNWLLSGGDLDAFRRQLGQIAEDNGISDWESDQGTYEAIGRGLKRAGIRGNRLESLTAKLGNSNEQSMKWIRSGYDSEEAN